MKKWQIPVVALMLLAIVGVGAWLVVADEGDNAAATKPDNNAPVWGDNLEILTGSTNLSVEETRETILLRDGFQRIDAATVEVAAIPPDATEPTWTGIATPYDDSEGLYWVVEPDFDRAGAWTLQITVTDAAGNQALRTIPAEVREVAYGIGVGELAPASESFTLDTPNRPDRITTDLTPNPIYYQMTVAEAVNSGLPSVIVFGTPELCTRKLWNLCGTVLDSFDEIAAAYEGRVNFVHVEIYNLETGRYVPAWDDYGLEVSPWIYVIDDTGHVAVRYDAIVGVDELRPTLERLLQG